MEFLRAHREKDSREKDSRLVAQDTDPQALIDDVWASAAQVSSVGIFVLLFIAGLYFSRPILMPVLAAMVIGTTLAIGGVPRDFR